MCFPESWPNAEDPKLWGVTGAWASPHGRGGARRECHPSPLLAPLLLFMLPPSPQAADSLLGVGGGTGVKGDTILKSLGTTGLK